MANARAAKGGKPTEFYRALVEIFGNAAFQKFATGLFRGVLNLCKDCVKETGRAVFGLIAAAAIVCCVGMGLGYRIPNFLEPGMTPR